jgi:hypothetical protein
MRNKPPRKSREGPAGVKAGGVFCHRAKEGEPAMPLYIVRFITTTEVIERQYPAATADDCMDIAEAHFRTWNADHGELHEVVVLPPEGECYIDGSDSVVEIYRLTSEGWWALYGTAPPWESGERQKNV